MRPKDENQHGSMRPNLMSSSARRAASEDNILAMLERESARHGSSSRMAWYGTGSALALVLAGALAWLAYDSGALHDDQVLTPVAVAPGASAPAVAAEAPRPAAIQPARAAAVADAAPEPVRLAQAGPPPANQAATAQPLVLLSAEQAASIQQAAAREAAPVRAAPRAAPSRAAPRKHGPRRALAGAARHKRVAASAGAARFRPAARPAPAPRRPAARPAPAPRPQRVQLAPPQAAEAPPDSDVALISAIISRSSRHAGAKGPAASEARP